MTAQTPVPVVGSRRDLAGDPAGSEERGGLLTWYFPMMSNAEHPRRRGRKSGGGSPLAFFPRNDRPQGLKREAFQTEIALGVQYHIMMICICQVP